MKKFETLDEAVEMIGHAIAEAERIALETGESFSIYPSYGMGGSFYPTDVNEDLDDSHWFPSSLGC